MKAENAFAVLFFRKHFLLQKKTQETPRIRQTRKCLLSRSKGNRQPPKMAGKLWSRGHLCRSRFTDVNMMLKALSLLETASCSLSKNHDHSFIPPLSFVFFKEVLDAGCSSQARNKQKPDKFLCRLWQNANIILAFAVCLKRDVKSDVMLLSFDKPDNHS